MTILELWERQTDLHGQCVEFQYNDPHSVVRFSVCGRLRRWQRKCDESCVYFFTVGDLIMESNVTVKQNTHAHKTYFLITGVRDDQTRPEDPRTR